MNRVAAADSVNNSTMNVVSGLANHRIGEHVAGAIANGGDNCPFTNHEVAIPAAAPPPLLGSLLMSLERERNPARAMSSSATNATKTYNAGINTQPATATSTTTATAKTELTPLQLMVQLEYQLQEAMIPSPCSSTEILQQMQDLEEQQELKLRKKGIMMQQNVDPLLIMNSSGLPPDVASIVRGIMGARQMSLSPESQAGYSQNS